MSYTREGCQGSEGSVRTRSPVGSKPEGMPYEYTEQGKALLADVVSFMDDHIYPNEAEYHEQYEALGHDGDPPMMDKLKAAARERGLWNMFLPHLAPDAPGTKLSNLDYAPISEQLGKVGFASEALNCSAPDTGNMEILNAVRLRDGQARLARPAARRRDPLGVLDDRARRRLVRRHQHRPAHRARRRRVRAQRHEVVLLRRRCGRAARCSIVMGKTDPNAARHLQQSMIVVPKDAKGVRIGRTPHVFGYDHAGGPSRDHLRGRPRAGRQPPRRGGRRLRHLPGPPRARPHPPLHALDRRGRARPRADGRARAASARTFGTLVAQKGLIQDWIAESRIEIDMGREYVLHTAYLMDTVGNKAAATEISGIKVAVPNMALRVIDRAIQVHGAAGVTQFTPLAAMYGEHAHAAHRRRPRRGAQDDHRPARDPPPRSDVPDEPRAKPAAAPKPSRSRSPAPDPARSELARITRHSWPVIRARTPGVSLLDGVPDALLRGRIALRRPSTSNVTLPSRRA